MKVVAFLNAYTQGLSGGDLRFIEIMKRLTEKERIELTVVTSKLGRDLCIERDLNAVFKVTTQEHGAGNVVFLYARRIIHALFLNLMIKTDTVLYSTSDFLPDVFPAFVWKLRNRKSKWVVCIFLVVPNLFRDYTRSFVKNDSLSLPTFRRLLYFLSQQFTISWAKHWANQILVMNKMDKKYLVETRGVEGSKVSVVNGGVDYGHIESLKANVKVYDGVFLGRFHAQKGIFDLIKIWKLICNKKANAKLCIVGSGPTSLVEKVRATVKENDLSGNITLVGHKTDDAKFLLLKSSSIFLCPSNYESFAIVIAEAMACGLPVVAYDLPIYKDIYGENISKVPIGDYNKFADAIMHFLNDAELRRTFGLEGQKFVQRYDWAEIAEKEYQLMVNVL